MIGGRFAVERACGSGGMGTVYRAVDQQSGRPVAVKVLHDRNPHLRQRFDREARTLATLDHPNIVRYVAHGTTDGELHYLVMEWIDGETLKARLSREGLSADEALAMAAAVADALAAAHARGVVHRDIKPSNLLFVDGDPAHVKLIDFGVARARAETTRLTEAGASVGTPGYMAPEQVRSLRDVDGRADLFALGCVLYECLSGRRAFSGSDAVEVWMKIVLAQPASLRALVPALPDPLCALVEQLLAKEPAERPADATAVGAALRALGTVGAVRRRSLAEDELPTMAAGPAAADSAPTVADAQPRAIYLVLATDSRGEARTGETGSARLGGEDAAAWQALRADVEALGRTHGGRIEFLADGSVVISFEGDAAAPSLAATAAGCALALRERLPGAMIALSSGTGPPGVVADGVISRGLRLIEAAALESVTGDAAAGDGVHLDETTARQLGDGFEVRPTLGGYQLRGRAAGAQSGDSSA